MQTTLCLLIRGNEILLAMKKRGFGMGKWNGVGGKMDAQKGDRDVFDAVVRETKEEIGVDIINPEKVGVFRFRFPYKSGWDQDVHLFLVRKWKGEPEESEEMAPKWFSQDKLPYDQMWDDDKLWMPRILKGEKLEADFIFREGEIIDKHIIKVI